ncbi:MAG: nitroreductase family protein [Anaerolineae bacterium]
MDLFEAISARYSHKGPFAATPVPSEHLKRIVEAGMAAPSANNRQSPEFVIVNNPDLLECIGAATQNVPLSTAPAVILVVSDTSQGPAETGFYLEDYAAATENMLLAATALGYACGWVDYVFRDATVRTTVCELLGVPADRLLLVAVPIGLAAEPAARRAKKPFPQRASWNRYAVDRPAK